MRPTRTNQSWHLYVARCSSGALYTGIAINPVERIEKHNSGRGAKAIRALGRPVKLVYQINIGSKSQALKAEAFFKSLDKNRKEKFISISKAEKI